MLCRCLEQVLKVEAFGEHRQAAVGRLWPAVPRAIPIELDAVLVRIAQIERLAHAMVARAVERDAGVDQAAQRTRERGAGRVEDRDVIEPGRALRRRRAALAFPGVEPDVMVIAAG